MELIDVLRGRWMYLAIAAPVLAGVIALTMLSSMAEQSVVATATVSVPRAVGSDTNQASLRTLLEDFSNAFTSRAVAEAAAETTGRNAEDLLRSLDASPAGSGSDVFVSLEGEGSAAAVQQELLEVSRAALTDITEADLELAALRLSAAERQVEETLAELQQLESEAGTTDLLNEYRQRSTDVQQLRTEIARSFTSPELQEALRVVYDEKLAEREELAELVTEWELRRNELTEASSARDAIEREQFSAETILERVQSDSFGLPIDVSSTSSIGNATIPTLAAMALALGAVVVMAMLSTRRQRPGAGQADPRVERTANFPRPAERSGDPRGQRPVAD